MDIDRKLKQLTDKVRDLDDKLAKVDQLKKMQAEFEQKSKKLENEMKSKELNAILEIDMSDSEDNEKDADDVPPASAKLPSTTRSLRTRIKEEDVSEDDKSAPRKKAKTYESAPRKKAKTYESNTPSFTDEDGDKEIHEVKILAARSIVKEDKIFWKRNILPYVSSSIATRLDDKWRRAILKEMQGLTSEERQEMAREAEALLCKKPPASRSSTAASPALTSLAKEEYNHVMALAGKSYEEHGRQWVWWSSEVCPYLQNVGNQDLDTYKVHWNTVMKDRWKKMKSSEKQRYLAIAGELMAPTATAPVVPEEFLPASIALTAKEERQILALAGKSYDKLEGREVRWTTEVFPFLELSKERRSPETYESCKLHWNESLEHKWIQMRLSRISLTYFKIANELIADHVTEATTDNHNYTPSMKRLLRKRLQKIKVLAGRSYEKRGFVSWLEDVHPFMGKVKLSNYSNGIDTPQAAHQRYWRDTLRYEWLQSTREDQQKMIDAAQAIIAKSTAHEKKQPAYRNSAPQTSDGTRIGNGMAVEKAESSSRLETTLDLEEWQIDLIALCGKSITDHGRVLWSVDVLPFMNVQSRFYEKEWHTNLGTIWTNGTLEEKSKWMSRAAQIQKSKSRADDKATSTSEQQTDTVTHDKCKPTLTMEANKMTTVSIQATQSIAKNCNNATTQCSTDIIENIPSTPLTSHDRMVFSSRMVEGASIVSPEKQKPTLKQETSEAIQLSTEVSNSFERNLDTTMQDSEDTSEEIQLACGQPRNALPQSDPSPNNVEGKLSSECAKVAVVPETKDAVNNVFAEGLSEFHDTVPF